MLTFKARPYQAKALDKIYSDLQVMPEALLSGIMGSGKTFMSCRLIQRLRAENPGMTFLILAHKKELISQFQESFKKFTDINYRDVGICCAGMGKKILDRQITIASIQTITNIKENYLGAGLIIIDEAHRIDVVGNTQYNQVLQYLRLQRPNCRVLGITATPYRLGLGYCYGSRIKKGASNLFSKCNHKITYEELRESGHLVPLKGVVATHKSMEQDLAGVTVQGEYNLTELGEICTREIHLHTAVEAIDEYCPDYDCICVVCVNIDHAEKLHALLDNSTIVHSQLNSIDRQQNMLDWEEGRKRIMVSVEILLEGYDLPRLQAIVFCRPTMSPALYLQAVGRVLRTCEGKDHGFLLDLTTNTGRFGTDLDNVKVTIPKEVEAQEKKLQEMFKICPNCEVEVHVALRECSECGFQWPEQECIIAETLPEMSAVNFTPESVIIPSPPEWYDVTDFTINIHESKKSEKLLGKITYTYKQTPYKEGRVYMWLCFADFYTGFAVTKAKERWFDVSTDNFPETVDEFMDSDFREPTRILINENGKYPELLEVETTDGNMMSPYEEEEYDDYENMAIEDDVVYDDDVPF